MKKTSLIALAAALAIATSPVAAADLIVDVPVIDDASSFDWEGLYVGGYLGYYPVGAWPYIGGDIGYDVVLDNNLIAGVGVSGYYYLDNTGSFEVFARGKLGVALDNVALYGFGGLGTANFANGLWMVGAGLEVALTDNVAWNVEVAGSDYLGSFSPVPSIQTGLRFRF